MAPSNRSTATATPFWERALLLAAFIGLLGLIFEILHRFVALPPEVILGAEILLWIWAAVMGLHSLTLIWRTVIGTRSG